jgi:hypothetical protein
MTDRSSKEPYQLSKYNKKPQIEALCSTMGTKRNKKIVLWK